MPAVVEAPEGAVGSLASDYGPRFSEVPLNVMHGDERAFFESFVEPAKRRRYVELLGSKRGRGKICSSLDHFKDLDMRFCQLVKPAEQNPTNTLRILRALGAGRMCHVMSSARSLDGRDMELEEALRETIGGGSGAIVSCVPGTLAYFESEERKTRYVCHRRT